MSRSGQTQYRKQKRHSQQWSSGLAERGCRRRNERNISSNGAAMDDDEVANGANGVCIEAAWSKAWC